MKKDLQAFLYQIRIDAEVHVIEMVRLKLLEWWNVALKGSHEGCAPFSGLLSSIFTALSLSLPLSIFHLPLPPPSSSLPFLSSPPPPPQPDHQISDYTYERTLIMEQRTEMLRQMKLTNRDRAKEVSICIQDSNAAETKYP